MGLSLYDYYCLTDWEFEFKVEGFQNKRALEQYDVRMIAYPAWFANAEKATPITEWYPIPLIDKKEKKEKWTPKKIEAIFGEYYPEKVK